MFRFKIISFGCRLWLVRSEHRYSPMETQSKLSSFLNSSIFSSLICFNNSSVAFICFPYSIEHQPMHNLLPANSTLAILTYSIFYHIENMRWWAKMLTHWESASCGLAKLSRWSSTHCTLLNRSLRQNS